MFLGLLSRVPFLGYIALAGWIAAGTAGWLYKEQVELTARVEEGCAAEMYKGALEQAVESMKRQSEIHQEWRVRMQEQIAAENVARIRAEAITGGAMRQLHEAQEALKEADQNACLDDYVNPDIIARLQ